MILQYLIERDRWEGQTRENAARQAFAWGTFDSTGYGTYAYPDVLDFGLTFIHEPIVTHSFSVDGERLDHLPRAVGGVHRWQEDGRGYFRGAFVYVVVDLFEPELMTPENSPPVVHSFLFTGIAIKDIGADQFRDD